MRKHLLVESELCDVGVLEEDAGILVENADKLSVAAHRALLQRQSIFGERPLQLRGRQKLFEVHLRL